MLPMPRAAVVAVPETPDRIIIYITATDTARANPTAPTTIPAMAASFWFGLFDRSPNTPSTTATMPITRDIYQIQQHMIDNIDKISDMIAGILVLWFSCILFSPFHFLFCFTDLLCTDLPADIIDKCGQWHLSLIPLKTTAHRDHALFFFLLSHNDHIRNLL